MAKGDGSISQIKRGVWRVCISFGKDPITGKRIKVQRNVKGTKSDARRVRDQIIREYEQGIKPETAKITFSEFVESWLKTRKATGRVSTATIKQEQTFLGYVGEYLGNIPIKDITPRMVEEAYTSIRIDRNFGGTTMNRLHTDLKSVMKKALDYELILRNPCDRVEAPKRDDAARQALSLKDCNSLLSCINAAEQEEFKKLSAKERRQKQWGHANGRSSIRGLCTLSCIEAVRIALASGMRRGEILALRWEDVSYTCRIVNVVHSLTVDGVLKTPKTKAGYRTIHLDGTTARHLTAWKEYQADVLEHIGIRQNETTPVCCSDVGGFIGPSNLNRMWRSFRKECGFPDLKFHELRHTQATQLLASGIDVKTVQTRLGHANAGITLNWYAHAVAENDAHAAEMLSERMLSPFKTSKQTPVIELKRA